MKLLRRTLGGYARHANFAGVLIVGLGCEANQISALLGAENLKEGPLLRTFSIQDTGGTAKTIAHGIGHRPGDAAARERRRRGSRCRRRTSSSACNAAAPTAIPGITANPALGAAVDLLVRHGGTAILSETPEIYGAEHLLTRRAVSRAVGEKLDRADQVVGGLHGAREGRDEQQSVARQQGGRAHDDPREVAGRGREGRHDEPRRRLRVRGAGHGEGLRLHGHAGLRPGVRDRAGGRRRQHDRVHDGSRLRVRLRAVAVAEALDQHRAVDRSRKRTSTSTAARSPTARRASTRSARRSSG